MPPLPCCRFTPTVERHRMIRQELSNLFQGGIILENNQGTASRPCGEGQGTLMNCAPLAVPFVPFQQTGGKTYSRADALANGTLFPELNLPFRAKAQASTPAENASSELQALEFVVTELGLYLDTHQSDGEAFSLYKQYAALAEEGRNRYIEMYGPLVQTDTVKADSYTWFNGPWPWEYCGNGGER